MNNLDKKTVKLFCDNVIYKFFNYPNKKDAQDWMRKETQLIPVHKRYRYHFEIPSILTQVESRKQNRL